MPTPLINSYHKKYGLGLKALEGYWEDAKEIAKKNHDPKGEEYFAIVMTIFKNMVKSKVGADKFESKSNVQRIDISESKAKVKNKKRVTKAKVPEWWKRMTPNAQRNYLSKHPNSAMSPILKKNLKPVLKKASAPSAEVEEPIDEVPHAVENPVPETAAPPEPKPEIMNIPDSRTEEEALADQHAAESVAKVAKDYEDHEPRNPSPKERAIFRNLFKAGGKAMKTVLSTVRDFSQGVIEGANEALQEYNQASKEENTDTEQMEGKTSKVLGILGTVATAALAVGIGAGIFMLAPGLGPSMAEFYFNRRTSESAEGKDLPDTVEELTKDFTDWLSHQDVLKLMSDKEGI